MTDLRWFDVTLGTPLRRIGWAWVCLVVALVVVVRAAVWLWRDWRDLSRGEGDYAPFPPDDRSEP